MKKIKVLLGLLVCGLIVTACFGTRTLTCTMTEEESGFKLDHRVSMRLRGNELVSMNARIIYTAENDVARDALSEVENQMSYLSEFFEDMNGVTTSSSRRNNTFTFEMDVNYSDLSEEDMEVLDIAPVDIEDINNVDIDEIRRELESEGFSCR